ncbi:hypothetical protein NBRC110019_16220 [Neptunitalea chrysea]|uniref:Lipoprotein n=1 Tax=Neptunitalea chrysea TaxID=1647581 RepID=A0A9W6EVJ6_9FLAO|nr:hypothetical protein [Neptunitalea chrysea]GLB52582.1 hypothetical protein NBRC110019_16220 [Neptunitalea chrysea]
MKIVKLMTLLMGMVMVVASCDLFTIPEPKETEAKKNNNNDIVANDENIKLSSFLKSNGLEVTDIKMLINDTENTRTSFKYGEKVVFNLYDVKGFTVEEDQIYPTASLYIIDSDGDSIYGVPNLLEYDSNGISKDSTDYTFYLSTFFDYGIPKEYDLALHLNDLKGTAEADFRMPFSLVDNNLFNIHDLTGITANQVFLNSTYNGYALTSHQTELRGDFNIIIKGLKGFKTVDGLTHPQVYLNLKDANKKSIIKSKNMFKDYTTIGVDPELLEDIITLDFNLSEGYLDNPVNIEVMVRDSISEVIFSADTNIYFN